VAVKAAPEFAISRMWTFEIVAIVCATFLFAGWVKGVVGLGLPTIALALLAATVGLKEAIALMLVPSMVTNVWQGLTGGAFMPLFRRLWLLLLMACLGAWIGVGILAQADSVLLTGLLGFMICGYAGISLVAPQIPPPGRWETVLSPAAGGIGGFVAGLTGSFIPGILYLQALGLSRDQLVQALGISFTVLTVALAAAFARQDLMTADLWLMSAVAVAPAALGMVLGQAVRRRLSEALFRRVFFSALLLLGAYLASRAFA
jgi:uncharacterized membrane protein YfcA